MFQVLAPNREAPYPYCCKKVGQTNQGFTSRAWMDKSTFFFGSMWGLHSKWTADQHVRAFHQKGATVLTLLLWHGKSGIVAGRDD